VSPSFSISAQPAGPFTDWPVKVTILLSCSFSLRPRVMGWSPNSPLSREKSKKVALPESLSKLEVVVGFIEKHSGMAGRVCRVCYPSVEIRIGRLLE
jgi:hypothetical protein